MPVISIVQCKTSYCNLEWDGFCSLRASTMGLLYAKCKVHLAYRPKNWSTTVRPFGMGCYGFARFVVGTWWVLFCFFYFGFLVPVGFCWAEGSGGVVVIVCLVVAGARGWDCLVLVLVWFGWIFVVICFLWFCWVWVC